MGSRKVHTISNDDAYGHEIYDAFLGKEVHEIVEREDGWIEASHNPQIGDGLGGDPVFDPAGQAVLHGDRREDQIPVRFSRS
jgi:hypothetical protein